MAEGSSQEKGAPVSCYQPTGKAAVEWVHQHCEEAGGEGNSSICYDVQHLTVELTIPASRSRADRGTSRGSQTQEKIDL